VLGISPWTTALEVYLEKTGQAPPQAENQAMRMGTLLEPIVARLYAEAHGVRLRKPPSILHHEDYPWMLASIDWWREADGRIVECKTAGPYSASEWGEAGTDEIPEHYQVQVQHQLAVCGEDEADIAVLIGGQDFRTYTVRRSQPIIDHLIEIECEFWERVQRRQPPPADWQHATTPRLIQAMHAPIAGLQVNLPDEALALADQYRDIGRVITQAERDRDYVKAKLAEHLGDAGVGLLSDGRQVTRTLVARKAYAVEASSYFMLKIKEPKKARAQ
jgi:putative phage-type endonuclease